MREAGGLCWDRGYPAKVVSIHVGPSGGNLGLEVPHEVCSDILVFEGLVDALTKSLDVTVPELAREARTKTIRWGKIIRRSSGADMRRLV